MTVSPTAPFVIYVLLRVQVDEPENAIVGGD
jgi:hypothetical protein